MRLFSFIAKARSKVFVQADPQCRRAQEQPSATRIQKRVHVAIGEEVSQSDIDEIYRQWTPSSAPLSPPYQVGIAPMEGLSAGTPGNGLMESERALSLVEGQQRNDRTLSLTVGTLSHPGITRRHKPNEDTLFAAQGMGLHHTQPHPFGLFIVADGMGGHAHGQEASRLAIQAMVDQVLPKVFGCSELHEADCRQILIDGVQAANWAIYQQNTRQRMEMGTTITAALVMDATAYMVNVGDSRTYLYRDPKRLRKVTKDHSVTAKLVENGIIQSDDIYTHPQRNQLYRSLGHKSSIVVDSFIEPLQPDDILLLCSDGLWEMVRDSLIEQILRNVPDAPQRSQALLEAALHAGGADNISLIMVHVSQISVASDATGSLSDTGAMPARDKWL
jgi:serine/threonine protein phosphatase PrpC